MNNQRSTEAIGILAHIMRVVFLKMISIRKTTTIRNYLHQYVPGSLAYSNLVSIFFSVPAMHGNSWDYTYNAP